jgi:formamidopyrimidine-DNA glycosylase
VPELPDITVYVEALDQRIVGQPLESLTIRSPFLLRTVDPPITAIEGRVVQAVRRLGKRIVFDMGGELYLVLHLMIAGRLTWQQRGAKPAGRAALASLAFPTGTLVLAEAGTKRRASLHLLGGAAALDQMNRGGLEVLEISRAAFAARLRSESHTLKRALTDPRLFSGIGNAYSDEMLHQARLSPLTLTGRLSERDIERLYLAVRNTLITWTDRLRAETSGAFPERVTAFRKEMAVHGRYRLPCPVCGSKVQRIRYAENETNYCARCQTGGKLLADRGLSRLLKSDWPRSIDDIE